MYLPETNAQMFDILTELRIYAAMNGMPNLAERLDDAMVLLAGRGPQPGASRARRRDWRRGNRNPLAGRAAALRRLDLARAAPVTLAGDDDL